MKRLLTTAALALALCAPSLADAKGRADFIEQIVNEDRFQRAEETARKVCTQVAETSYEVAMKHIDCPIAMRALEMQAFRSAADLYNQFNVPGHEREADILSQLFMEANGTYRGQHWWLEGGE